jgi:hypothetical protein
MQFGLAMIEKQHRSTTSEENMGVSTTLLVAWVLKFCFITK